MSPEADIRDTKVSCLVGLGPRGAKGIYSGWNCTAYKKGCQFFDRHGYGLLPEFLARPGTEYMKR